MYQSSRVINLTVVVLLAMIIFTAPLAGQSLWLRHDHKPAFSLEFYKIEYEYYHFNNYDTELLNMNVYLSAYIPASSDVGVVFEIPFTNFSLSENSYIWDSRVYKQSSVGNPYVGIEYENPKSNFIGTLGIRFPLSNDNKPEALSQGMTIDPDRIEAFAVKRFNIYASAIYNYRSPKGFTVRTGLGPMVSIPTETKETWFGSGPDTELYLRYFSQLWMEAGDLTMAAGLTGLMWLTSDDSNIGEMTFHHINLAGFYQIGIFRPGLFFIAPLDNDYTYIKDYTYGLSLTFEFEKSFR